MDDYIKKIMELDASDDIEALIKYADTLPDLDYPICQLMAAKRYRSAYLLTKVTEKTPIAESVVQLSRCIGGYLMNQHKDEILGLESLRKTVDVLPVQEYPSWYKQFLEPAVQHILNMAVISDDSARILRGLEIAKAGFPEFRHIFDTNAPVLPLNLEKIRQEGYKKSRLLHYPLPPLGVERPARRAVVAIRELIYPGEKWSRPLDMGPRISRSLENYGWDVSFYGIQCTDLNIDFMSIYSHCISHQADVLIMDDHMIEADYAWASRRSLIQALRSALPDIKIVGVHFDAWALDQDGLATESEPLDLVWEVTSPSLPVWERPEFFDAQGRSKVLHTQHPHAFAIPDTVSPLNGNMLFSGGIKGYNWQRAFWSRLMAKYNLPVTQRLTTHADDGLSALDSYHVFMNGLAQAGCSLNFSMRSDLTRIVTGRCFETIITGSLLIQEETPDMDYYFVSGEHYLPFTTFADLRSCIDFVLKNPEQAEEIRQRGIIFARQHYTDEAIIGYIEAALFYPG